jgi:hypothetical protein
MERIGMHRDPKDDFDHPKLPENHHLRKHVLYRLKKTNWEKNMNRQQNSTGHLDIDQLEKAGHEPDSVN